MEDERIDAERKEQFLRIASELIDWTQRLRKLRPPVPTGPGPYIPDNPFGDARRGAPPWVHHLLDAIWSFFSDR